MERFVAHYRQRRNAQAINEIASTLVFVFSAIGLVGLTVVAAIAWNMGAWFNLEGTQARTGGIVLTLVALQFAVGLPFAIFGAVVNGFQRTVLNSAVGTVVAIVVAVVNVVALLAGAGLIELVAAMTATRMIGYIAYRLNAYRVFPMLRIRPSLFRMTRLREVSRFSVYVLIQEASNKVNYATDPIVIAAVLMTGAVAVWTVAQRLTDMVLRLTNQLNEVLFPIVVDCDSAQRDDRLRDLLVQGTRLSLATALPVAGSLALLAEPVVIGWTGAEFRSASTIVEILSVVVLVRIGGWTASTVLQGAGHHRLLALSNLAGAAVNIGLSVLLIGAYGLPGVAFATLVPVTIRALTVLIPFACVRVGISPWRFLTTAVWPAVWPGMVVLGGLASMRGGVSSLGQALVYGTIAGVLYGVVFVGVAVGREDRNRYVGKLRSIAGWPALETA
jgi:O-antigen/teichoic acid export membrane protein